MGSGDVLAKFFALGNEPPAANIATLDLRNFHPVLDFDATTDEEAVWTNKLSSYDGGGITALVGYSMSSAEANDVVFQGALERIGDQQLDVDGDSFAAFQSSGAVTVPGTSGLVDVLSITFTDGAQMDSVADEEQYRFKLRRDADSTSDTDNASGDAEVHFVEIRET